MAKIRYGVIGVKGVGEHHIRIINNNSNTMLTSIADVDEKLVKKKAQELGVEGFTDYKDLITKNIVDAVSICTPHNLHALLTLDFLDAGIHVLVEKPLANKISDADKLVKTAEKNNLKLCVGHQYRTHRSSQVIKNLIDSRKIGKIMRVLWSWSSFRPEQYYDQKSWHSTWEESGAGILMNQVSHDLDLICWLIGQPLEVTSIIGNQLHKAEIEDIACVNILFQNGVYGTFQFTINQPEAFSVRQIFGDKGAIILNDVRSLTNDMNDEITLCTYQDNVDNLIEKTWNPKLHIESGKLTDLKKKKSPKSLSKKIKNKIANKLKNILYPPQKVDWLNWKPPVGHHALINNFIDSIINDTKPDIDGESARITVELINAIILSGMRKETVKLPVDRDEYDELFEELKTGRIKVPRFRN